MEAEIESGDNYLDKATKWVFASEKGTTVFAIYGIGDGTVPTPLYAVGGKKAGIEYGYLNEYLEGKKNGANGNQSAFNRRLAALRSRRVAESGNLYQDGHRGEKDRNGAVHRGTRESDRGRADGRGAENRGEVKPKQGEVME